MTLDEITQEWLKDSQIDAATLDSASLLVPSLHAKYYRFLVSERLLWKKKQLDHKRLVKVKYEYFRGKLSEEELKELGWKQFSLKITKDEVPVYIDGDSDVISSLLSVAAQEEKVSYLLDILKMLQSRGFQIKNAIDFVKWSSGG